MTVAIVVKKKVAYRSVEIFFCKFLDVGEGHLRVYRPPGGSEEVLLEQFPDKTILYLLPARVGAIAWIMSPLAPALLRRLRFPFYILFF